MRRHLTQRQEPGIVGGEGAAIWDGACWARLFSPYWYEMGRKIRPLLLGCAKAVTKYHILRAGVKKF